MERIPTYYKDKNGELYAESVYIEDGTEIAKVTGERPRGAQVISEQVYTSLVNEQVLANEEARLAREQAAADAAAQREAGAAERALVVQEWLEKMDAPPEVVAALLGSQDG